MEKSPMKSTEAELREWMKWQKQVIKEEYNENYKRPIETSFRGSKRYSR